MFLFFLLIHHYHSIHHSVYTSSIERRQVIFRRKHRVSRLREEVRGLRGGGDRGGVGGSDRRLHFPGNPAKQKHHILHVSPCWKVQCQPWAIVTWSYWEVIAQLPSICVKLWKKTFYGSGFQNTSAHVRKEPKMWAKKGKSESVLVRVCSQSHLQ